MQLNLVDHRKYSRGFFASFEEFLHIIECIVGYTNASGISLFMQVDNLIPSFADATGDESGSVYLNVGGIMSGWMSGELA
jgi:hypothetical protein